MNKEEILEMSREENKGGIGEYEKAASDTASKVGLTAGAIACVVLVILGNFILEIPEISLAGWMVFFAMFGGNHIALFKKLGTKHNLALGIVSIIASVVFCTAIILKSVM